MSKGKVRCVGTALDLKQEFGIGYHLSFVMLPTDFEVKAPHCDQEALLAYVQESLPGTELLHSGHAEVSVQIPQQAASRFPGFLRGLHDRQEGTPITRSPWKKSLMKELGFKSYGLDMTTLEEVFLKIALEEEEAENQDN